MLSEWLPTHLARPLNRLCAQPDLLQPCTSALALRGDTLGLVCELLEEGEVGDEGDGVGVRRELLVRGCVRS